MFVDKKIKCELIPQFDWIKAKFSCLEIASAVWDQIMNSLWRQHYMRKTGWHESLLPFQNGSKATEIVHAIGSRVHLLPHFSVFIKEIGDAVTICL